MTHFDCGCETDGSARCDAHGRWFCHNLHAYVAEADNFCIECGVVGSYGHTAEYECPPCRLSRLRSVSLSPKATPTRRGAA